MGLMELIFGMSPIKALGNVDWSTWKGDPNVSPGPLPYGPTGGGIETDSNSNAGRGSGNPRRGGYHQSVEPPPARGNGDSNVNAGLGNNSFFDMLGKFSGGASNLGFSNLMDILNSQGRTSPDLLNRQLTGISRDTEANQAGLTGELANRGLSGSGLGMALGQAVGAHGVDSRSGAVAEDNRLAEERRRGDLQLFKDLIIDPSTDDRAISAGQYNASAARSDNKNNALITALGAYLAGL